MLRQKIDKTTDGKGEGQLGKKKGEQRNLQREPRTKSTHAGKKASRRKKAPGAQATE